MSELAFQQCIAADCGARYDLGEALFACRQCGSLLDVRYDWARCSPPKSLRFFESRWPGAGGSRTGPRSRAEAEEARLNAGGVWRFRELLPFASPDALVSIGEGRTTFQQADGLAGALRMKPGRLFLQYEGFNPSGSFKDNGMAAAFTVARKLGKRRVACASTGNTSASLALYAAHTRTLGGEPMQAVVFVGGGKIALGKLAQALDHGATTIQIDGDFDACMRIIDEAADRLGLYVVNSINPFRLEGQKTIMYRVLEALDWEVPDWIVVPGGNLGNSSAFGKAFMELKELGLVDRIPRLAIINAAGANALYELYEQRGLRWNGGRWDRTMASEFEADRRAKGVTARTVASAIEIGRPVNLPKALRSLDAMHGVVRQVDDDAILDAKAMVGRHGYGCEPASAASVAGLRALLDDSTISPSDRVVCILTGHALKDPDATIGYHQSGRGSLANAPLRCAADCDAIARLLRT
jgi:threonine synthase